MDPELDFNLFFSPVMAVLGILFACYSPERFSTIMWSVVAGLEIALFIVCLHRRIK